MSITGYFPYRAHKNRPYINEFLNLPDKERRWDILMQLVLSRTRRSFGERETINADPNLAKKVHACCMHESWLASALADFFAGGQVVFHIAPVLKEAFMSSELGDATVNDLKFPFDSSYLHIGDKTGLLFNDGRAELEGVFLHLAPNSGKKSDRADSSLRLSLVGHLVDSAGEPLEPENWGERGRETFTFFFGSKEMDMPILDGTRAQLEHMGKDPAEDDNFSDLSEFGEDEQKSIRETWATHSEARRLHRENIPVVLECVRMVANALLFVSQYPQDMADDFQDGFPPAFREKIERSVGKALERNLSKARNNGFTVIKRVGGAFEHAMQVELTANGEGASPAPHLRRAHWRRQAFDAGLTHRKLIWIRAAKVLGGTTRERPYLVDGRAPGAMLETAH